MPAHRKKKAHHFNEHYAYVPEFAAALIIVGAIWAVGAHHQVDAPPAATAPSIAPVELPEVITGKGVAAMRLVEPEVVTPAQPKLTEAVKPAAKNSPATTPKTKTATAPTPTQTIQGGTGAKPPAYSSIPVAPGVELYCTNGYQHADGTCSSTPEYPKFSAPAPGKPCSGTASACLDAISGIVNPIAGLLGSGS